MPSIPEYSGEYQAMNNTENIAATLDLISNSIDSFLQNDSKFPSMSDSLKIAPGSVTVSGMQDTDYPNLEQFGSSLKTLSQFVGLKTIPLPKSLLEQFGEMVQRCEMGIFPEIGRAWLAVDTNIFLWKYDTGTDIAYFDIISRLIINVGLIKPKAGVFRPHIKHILIIVTFQEILLFGITFTDIDNPDNPGDLLVIPEPIFTLPTDNVEIQVIRGTISGRIFLGGNDGNLYEISYQSDSGWFGNRFKKINHSSSLFSFLIPNLFQSTANSPIVQIEVDESRHIVYSLNQNGDIQVFELGENGDSFSHVVTKYASSITREASTSVTIDDGNFKQIVSISAIDQTESININLVAVTKTGVRLYFTCTPWMSPEARPSTLTLVHIRLPPGFAAASVSHRPNNVHLAQFQRGNFVFLSSSDNKDTLWTLSGDSFAFNPELSELYSIIPLDSKIWSFKEELKPLSFKPFDSIQLKNRTVLVDVPALITQHMEAPKKFVFITPQGVITGYKPRVVDQLKQLLLENRGFDNDAVRSFFELHFNNNVNACSIALILACEPQAPGEERIVEWATFAFFKYGKNMALSVPQMTTFGMSGDSYLSPSKPGLFRPNNMMDISPQMSPIGNRQINGNNATALQINEPLGKYSCQCRALFAYFSRIIRPIWNCKVSTMRKSPEDNKKDELISNVGIAEIQHHLMKLSALGQFLLVNLNVDENCRKDNSHANELSYEERNFISGLYLLLKQTLEVFNLWKLLCVHQFQSVTECLTPEKQQQLCSATFKDLIVYGTEMTSLLASSLVRKFIEDNSSTDVINRRLQELCPSIYKNENALHAKAHEIILRAKSIKNDNDRKLAFENALELCKKIGTKINLHAVCELFTSVHWYDAVVEICLLTAHNYDPQNIALHFQKNRQQFLNDDSAKMLYNSRMECYRLLLDIYGRLAQHGKSMFSSRMIESSPLMNELSPERAKELANHMLEMAMMTTDELFHLTLYDWLYENGQTEKMLEMKSPLLEVYLKEKTVESNESIPMLDILWVYYEKTGQFKAAAMVLSQLAEKSGGDGLDLEKRIEYLSRAIVCMKSLDASTIRLPPGAMNVGSMASVGEFLHSLEEKMDVARIQKQILNEITSLDSREFAQSDIDDAIRLLNSNLLDITELYRNFAEPFELFEAQLKIIMVSGYENMALINDIWQKILEKEINKVLDMDALAQKNLLYNKLKILCADYVLQDRFFPIDMIIQILDGAAALKEQDPCWFAKILLELRKPLSQVFDTYQRLYNSCAGRMVDQISLMQVLVFLINSIKDSDMMSTERNYFYSKALDCIAGYNLDIKSFSPNDKRVPKLAADLAKTKVNVENFLKSIEM